MPHAMCYGGGVKGTGYDGGKIVQDLEEERLSDEILRKWGMPDETALMLVLVE
jgi:hypothetical protein